MEDLIRLDDERLLERSVRLAAAERESTVDLVACLGEIDRRRDLLLDRGYAHLFDYCVRRLGLSEGAASRRVAAARASRRAPEVLARLREGSLTLWTLCRLEPFLRSENASDLLARACRMPRHELEALVLELSAEKRRAEAAEMRRTEGADAAEGQVPLLEGGPQMHDGEPAARPADRITTTGPERIRFSFECSVVLKQKLERAGALLSSRLSCRRLEELIEALADLALARYEGRSRRARAVKGNPRRVPWPVRKEVWRRDGARCAYTAEDGTRCSATRRLQYDHVTPWALGGRSDDPANIRLLCRAHNLREGRKAFPEATARALAARAAATGKGPFAAGEGPIAAGKSPPAQAAPTSSVP